MSLKSRLLQGLFAWTIGIIFVPIILFLLLLDKEYGAMKNVITRLVYSVNISHGHWILRRAK